MKQKCTCGAEMNVAYIYTKKKKYEKRKAMGAWVAIGHYCRTCGRFTPEKKLKLSEGIKAKASKASS